MLFAIDRLLNVLLMIKNSFLIVCIFLQYFVLCLGGFDWVLGNTSVWLCAASYCPANTYLNKTYTSYSSGFIPVYVINEFSVDVQVIFEII